MLQRACFAARRGESTPSTQQVLDSDLERGEMSKMAEEEKEAPGNGVARDQQQLAAGESARARPLETLLRAAPLGLCVAAMAVMLRDRQTNEYGAVSYADLGGFKYLVCANGIGAFYSLASAFYTAVPRRASLASSWAVFLFDQVRSIRSSVCLASASLSFSISAPSGQNSNFNFRCRRT
jgi:hypothetical protein